MIPEQRLQDFIQQNRMTDGEEFIDRLSQAILDGSLSSPPADGGLLPCPLSVDEQVPMWDAINEYVLACKGDPARNISVVRMKAVAKVNEVVGKIKQAALNTRTASALVQPAEEDEMVEPCAAINCKRFCNSETDWCLADAMRESLKEHMKLLKQAQERIAKFEYQRLHEIVIGDRRIFSPDGTFDGIQFEGTVIGTTHVNQRINDMGLAGKWLQIIVRPVQEIQETREQPPTTEQAGVES